MATFSYTVRDNTGAVKEGTSQGDSKEAVARKLMDQGLVVQDINEVKGKAKPSGGGVGGVKLADLSIFCRQFSTMIDAGVSLVRCLNVLGEQTQNQKLKFIVGQIEEDVQAGQTLSKSMSKFPRVFNELFIGLVNAGEVGGALEESLQRLSSFLEADMELRRKVKGAMTYPVIVMVFATIIVLGLVTFVLPKFMEMFVELGMTEDKMPTMTVMMMKFSHFLTSKWPFAVGGLVAFIIAFRAFVQTRVGKRAYDVFKLKAPVFGKLNHKICIARFARTLATLLSSGVPILQSMETVAGTVSNDVIGEAILTARTRIREGDRIGDPLQKSKLFPPMVTQMISIGEESGAIDQMLTKIAEFYEADVDAALQSLTSAIEPIMIIFLGGAVGFIVISMFLPLISIMQGVGAGED